MPIRRYGKKVNSMKKENTGKLNKRRRFFASVLVAMSLVIGGMTAYAVLENEKSGSLRSVKMTDDQIEMSTLIIGSHLIHLNGLTDELYETAVTSASEFNQYQMYYKSELAEGAWFEISEAVSIGDITTSGRPVEKSVIEALEFTHKTGADGITVDLRTGKPVSIFDIPDPYDLSAMEELEPLRIQLQILQDKTDKNTSDKTYINMIKRFFEKDIQSDTTRQCDASLDALENYKNGLSSREKPSMWTEKTETVMTSVDAERRVVSLTKLSELLDALQSEASGYRELIEDEEYVYQELVINSEVVSAVGDCIENVQESIISYEAKRMTDDGVTVSAQAEYRYSQELISKAKASDTAGCDAVLEKFCDLQNILDGVIANQDTELSTLMSDLEQAAYQKYMADLRTGTSETYRAAQAQGSSQAILNQYLTETKTEADADRLEYQTMLDARFKRMENEKAKEYTLQLIDGIPVMEQTIPADAAASYLKETVDEHLLWLQDSYAALVKAGNTRSEMDNLQAQKDELAKKRQDALDNNDLKEAKKLTAEMEAKQRDIDKLAASLNDILNSPNSSETDKAKAKAAMGESNTSALLANMANQLASDIRNGEADASSLQNQMAALAATAGLDPEAGLAALEQVGDALANATGLDGEVAAALGDSLSDAKKDAQAAADAMADGNLSEDALTDLLDSILSSLFGTSFENATSAQQAAAILAMEWYGNAQSSEDALSVAASLAKQAKDSGNQYIYDKYILQDAYLSLQAMSKVLSYRYVFDDAHDTATLQKGKEYYLFTLGVIQYETSGDAKKDLKAAPEFMNTLYICSQDSEKIFDTKAEYIQKAPYGVVGTPSVETQATEIYNSLTEGGA